MSDPRPPDPALMRRLADTLSEGLMTGVDSDWPNSQDELTRLQSAELLHAAADELEARRAAAAPAGEPTDDFGRMFPTLFGAGRAASPAGEPAPAEEAFFQVRFWKQACDDAHNLGAERLEKAVTALHSIVRECRGLERPYSHDSYLPPHLLDLANAALESIETPRQVIEAMRHDEELS